LRFDKVIAMSLVYYFFGTQWSFVVKIKHNHYINSTWTPELTHVLIDEALRRISLRLQVACGPVAIHQLPVSVDENSIPAVVWRCTRDRCTRLIVNTFCPSCHRHAVHSRIATTTVIHRYNTVKNIRIKAQRTDKKQESCGVCQHDMQSSLKIAPPVIPDMGSLSPSLNVVIFVWFDVFELMVSTVHRRWSRST